MKAEENNLDVRLITARQYLGMMEAEPETDLETRLEAALYFIANLTMHMRLDRLDGTGDLAWADAASVYPTLRGRLSRPWRCGAWKQGRTRILRQRFCLFAGNCLKGIGKNFVFNLLRPAHPNLLTSRSS